MKHYEVGEWTDFVRSLVAEPDRIEMEQHLAGCPQCGAVVEFLRGVARAAQAESSYESATSELAAPARDVFSGLPAPAGARDRVMEAFHTLVANLTYDSAADLRPAGARALAASSRQLLYEAGEFSVDLRFELETESSRTTLVGQVASRKHPHRWMNGLPVAIHSGAAVLATASTNEFGEFELEYTPRQNMSIRISVTAAAVRLDIPLEHNGDEEEHE